MVLTNITVLSQLYNNSRNDFEHPSPHELPEPERLPTVEALASKKMVSAKTTTDFVSALFAAGHITSEEVDHFNELRAKERTQDIQYGSLGTIKGNITISLPPTKSFSELEAISRVFNTAELLERVLPAPPFTMLLWPVAVSTTSQPPHWI